MRDAYNQITAIHDITLDSECSFDDTMDKKHSGQQCERRTIMVIGSVGTGAANGALMGAVNGNMTEDAISKNLKNQIANAQKKLQELSNDDSMSMEDKMKRRQEIQQEITSLNQELRQHQIDLRREQQEKAREAAETNRQPEAKTAASEKENAGMSDAGMQAMVSADSALKMANVCDSVTISAEGRARVLKSEIEQDQNRGVDTARKEEELADTEKRIEESSKSQMSALADASEEFENAGETEQEERLSEHRGKTEEADEKREEKESK